MLIQNDQGKTTFSKEVISKIVNKTLSMTEGISSRSSYMGSLTRKLSGNSTYGGIELRENLRTIDSVMSMPTRQKKAIQH